MSHRRTLVVAVASSVLVFAGSAAGALGGLTPTPPVRPPATPVLPGDPAGVLSSLEHLPLGSLTPAPAVPGLPGPVNRGVRNLLDLANRPRTGRKFPSVPTAVPGGAGDPFAALPQGGYASYGTGTAYHTDAALSGDRGTDIDVGFAGVASSSGPLLARFDELNRRVAPPLKSAGGYGQGDAAQIGILQAQGADGSGAPDIATTAEQSAPPNKAPASNDQSDLNLGSALDADMLHAEAAARSAATGCVVGSDLAYGLGSATDTKALAVGADQATVGTDGDGPPRAASQSVTRTRLIPRPGSDRFGLVTETRQTIAPTTIRRGTPDELTIEVAGEWILTGTVDGVTSRLDYGPDVDSNETSVLRVTRPEHPGEKNRGRTIEVANVTAQQLMGQDGVIVELSPREELVVGELPRAIRDDHGSLPLRSATRVAAATDVARVRLLDQPGADLRVGHMEVAATVPDGGIACPGIGVRKSLDSSAVRPGDHFTWGIDVSNANDCVLDGVKVVDTISAPPGVRYQVVSSDPPASQEPDGSLTFDNLGPLAEGQSRRLIIGVDVDRLSAPGSLHDLAVAEGVCGPDRQHRGRDDGPPGASVPLTGRAELDGPAVGAVRVGAALPPVESVTSSAAASRNAAISSPSSASASAAAQPSHAGLANTGGLLGILPAWMLISGGSVLRRFRRRRA